MRRTLNENTIILSKKKHKDIIKKVLENITSFNGVFLSDEIIEIAEKQIKIRWKSTHVVLIGSVGTGAVSSTLKAGEPILISFLYKEVERIYRETLDKYTLSLYAPVSSLEIERLELLRIIQGSIDIELIDPVQSIGISTEVNTSSLREWILPLHRVGTVTQSLISKKFIRKQKNLRYSITAEGYRYFALKKHNLSTLMPPGTSALTPNVITSISTIVKNAVSSTLHKMGMSLKMSGITELPDGISLSLKISPTDISGGELFWRGKWYRVMGELGDRVILRGVKNDEYLDLSRKTVKRLDIKKKD